MATLILAWKSLKVHTPKPNVSTQSWETAQHGGVCFPVKGHSVLEALPLSPLACLRSLEAAGSSVCAHSQLPSSDACLSAPSPTAQGFLSAYPQGNLGGLGI